MRTIRVLAVATLLLAALPAPALADKAAAVVTADKVVFNKTEYAVRWPVTKDGSNDAEWVLKTLFATVEASKIERKAFRVRYFDWQTRFSPLDSTIKEILRARSKISNGVETHELMYKLRGNEAFDVAEAACPLSASNGVTLEQKGEIDASLSDAGTFENQYSFSCSLEKGGEPYTPPVTLKVTEQACVRNVDRIDVKIRKKVEFKIESWHFPDGPFVEVSSGDVSEKEFREKVAPILAAKLQITTEGKTQISGPCTPDP